MDWDRNRYQSLYSSGLTNTDSEDYGGILSDRPKPFGICKHVRKNHTECKFTTRDTSIDVCPSCGNYIFWTVKHKQAELRESYSRHCSKCGMIKRKVAGHHDYSADLKEGEKYCDCHELKKKKVSE